RLDLPALRHWLASRPPGDGRLPPLIEGLHVREGRIDGDGWRVESLALDKPQLRADAPVRARAPRRYADAATRAPFDLAATLQRPASGRGFAVVGALAPARADWRVPMQATLSGALHWDDALALLPARFGASGRYESGDTVVPFIVGLHGPLRAHGPTWRLVPASLTLRGGGLVPQLDARGRLVSGQRLLLRLDGRSAEGRAQGPPRPRPLGAATRPLALPVASLGPLDRGAPLGPRVARDGLRFDGHLDLPGLMAWAGTLDQGS